MANTIRKMTAGEGCIVIKLFDGATKASIGIITETQLNQLIDALEEESEEDRDYYINRDTFDLLQERGVDAEVIDLLRRALGEGEDMDIRWEPS